MSLRNERPRSQILAMIALVVIILIQFGQSIRLRNLNKRLSSDLDTCLANISSLLDQITRQHSYHDHIRNIQFPTRGSNDGLILAIDENACGPCVLEEIEIMKQSLDKSEKNTKHYILIPESLKWKYKNITEAHNYNDVTVISDDSTISLLFTPVSESILYVRTDSTGKPQQFFFPISSVPELSFSFCR